MAEVDEQDLLAAIQQMVDTEHQLRQALGREGVDRAAARAQLDELEISLDRCWDLLRQRRAKVEFHQDADQARLRAADVVERYWS